MGNAKKIATRLISAEDQLHSALTSDYSGVGCPNCGPDADVEGDHVEIIESGVHLLLACDQCDNVWTNMYRFDGIAGGQEEPGMSGPLSPEDEFLAEAMEAHERNKQPEAPEGAVDFDGARFHPGGM